MIGVCCVSVIVIYVCWCLLFDSVLMLCFVLFVRLFVLSVLLIVV